MHSGLPFTKEAVLIFLWGALSLGDGSEAPRELVGLPLADLEMGEACEAPGVKPLLYRAPWRLAAGGWQLQGPFTKHSQRQYWSQVIAKAEQCLLSYSSLHLHFICIPSHSATTSDCGSPRKEGRAGKEGRGKA